MSKPPVWPAMRFKMKDLPVRYNPEHTTKIANGQKHEISVSGQGNACSSTKFSRVKESKGISRNCSSKLFFSSLQLPIVATWSDSQLTADMTTFQSMTREKNAMHKLPLRDWVGEGLGWSNFQGKFALKLLQLMSAVQLNDPILGSTVTPSNLFSRHWMVVVQSMGGGKEESTYQQ